MENCGATKGFGFIYIYRLYIHKKLKKKSNIWVPLTLTCPIKKHTLDCVEFLIEKKKKKSKQKLDQKIMANMKLVG